MHPKYTYIIMYEAINIDIQNGKTTEKNIKE